MPPKNSNIHGFFSMPHGSAIVLPLILTIMAIALSLATIFVCSFVELSIYVRAYDAFTNPDDYQPPFNPGVDGDGNDLPTTAPKMYVNEDKFVTTTYSLSLTSEGEKCTAIHDLANFEYWLRQEGNDFINGENIDWFRHNDHWFLDPDHNQNSVNHFRAAAGFAGVALIMGAIASQMLWTATCIKYSRLHFFVLAGVFGLTAFFQVLTLIVFSADICESRCANEIRNKTAEDLQDAPSNDLCSDGCIVAAGAGSSIAAFFMWTMLTVMTALLGIYTTGDDATADGEVAAVGEEADPLVADGADNTKDNLEEGSEDIEE